MMMTMMMIRGHCHDGGDNLDSGDKNLWPIAGAPTQSLR